MAYYASPIIETFLEKILMAHGLETLARLNAEAIAAYERRKASESFSTMSPAMRERGIRRLLAAIDLAIHQGNLNSRSVIADARLDLGGIMEINEARNIIWPEGKQGLAWR